MKSLKKTLFAVLIAASACAQAGTISAVGEGWCSTSTCNNTNTNIIQNTLADSISPLHHDWFAFNTSVGNVSSATLSIWNYGNNYYNPSAIYDLYAASSIDFAGLVSGPSLGSITAGAADTRLSSYVTINLNAQGISFLNANQGNQVIFGGGVTGTNAKFFGYTDGHPVATLTVVAVPEPATYAMMRAGLGLIGFMARRKKSA